MSGVFSLKRIAGIGKSILSWYEHWPLKPNPTTSRFPIRLRPWTQAFCSFCTCLSDENNSRPAIVPKILSCTSLTSMNKWPQETVSRQKSKNMGRKNTDVINFHN